MRTLFLCNTPYQLMTAVQICNSIYSGEKSDVIITNNIAQYEVLVERCRHCSAFDNVYSFDAKKYNWNNWEYIYAGILFDHRIENQLKELMSNDYDNFFFANRGGCAECLAEFFRRKLNVKLCMYEDGFVSYSDFYHDDIEDAFHPRRLKYKLLYMCRKRAVSKIKEYYVYNPDLIKKWDFDFAIKGIPPIDGKTVDVLNVVFDYASLKDNYSNFKYIFFEESYYADGIDIGDENILKLIADIVGINNIMIKIHPRNPVNRFAQMGYFTNSNTSVPWEIIALNQDLKETKLITISSGSSITSYCLRANKAQKSILLYRYQDINKDKLTPSIHVFDKVCNQDSYFVFPKTKKELIDILKDKK